jgi:hypothetical protein
VRERLTVTEVRALGEVTAFGDCGRRYTTVGVVAEGRQIRRLEWWVGSGPAPQVGEEIEVKVKAS